MECRLEDFTTDFIDHVLPFCIQMFRKIYKDIFNDNVYRSDFTTKAQIAEFDCEQLLQNIVSLSRPKKLCLSLQEIIITKCSFSSTESDKFNLYGDDRIQQKRFASAEDTNEESFTVIKRIFDGINNEDALEVLSTR